MSESELKVKAYERQARSDASKAKKQIPTEQVLEPPIDGMVAPYFTREEAAVILSLIKSGWSSAVLGSRRGFELLASVEDKLTAAGAVETSIL